MMYPFVQYVSRGLFIKIKMTIMSLYFVESTNKDENVALLVPHKRAPKGK